jgi:hypothetical protein
MAPYALIDYLSYDLSMNSCKIFFVVVEATVGAQQLKLKQNEHKISL